MPYFIISINPLFCIISYLCACARVLELNYVDRDGLYFYGFSINNYDKEKSQFNYFVFAEDICISMIKKEDSVSFLFEKKNITQGANTISLDKNTCDNRIVYRHNSRCVDSYRLVFKHKWKDPLVRTFYHTVRVYSSGVVIHSTKLFKFIYRIDSNGNLTRRQL